MRAIDADALIEFIENRYEITWKDDYEGGIKDACTDILEKISKMPTIEPERKKGKWIKHYRGYWTFVNKDGERDGWIPDYECSECGSRGWKYADDTMNFCPNCGAYMREETDAD